MTIHWGQQSRWQTDVSIKNHIVTMPEELWVEVLELVDTGRDAKRELSNVRATNRELLRQLDEARAELKSDNAVIANWISQACTANAENERLHAELDASQEAHANANGQVERAEIRLEQSRAELRAAQAQSSALQQEKELLNDAANNAEAGVAMLQKDIAALTDEVAYLKQRIESITEQDSAALKEREAQIAALETQKTELLDALSSVTNQACRMDDGTLDSMALSANAKALEMLAEFGEVVIDGSFGRRVIAHWKKGGER